MYELIFPILGIALCAMVLVQFFQWSAGSYIRLRHDQRQFQLSRDAMREFLEKKFGGEEADVVSVPGNWKGFREFVVSQTERESEDCKSIYLKPADGKPIVDFRAGQFLTLEFDIPGEPKPVVRCYSLSSGPVSRQYRITVKVCGPPSDNPDVPPGKVSRFINQQLRVGDRVRAKTPAGSFFLDEQSTDPLVLLAGGIGVTPMLSMLDREIQLESGRLILLMYGVRNGREHAFRDHLAQLADEHSNVHVVNLYSQPDPGDRQGDEYHLPGYVSVDLVKNLLPHKQCQFYLCGPPAFMNSVHSGLREWGVPESGIFLEAFGPATVRREKPKSAAGNSTLVKGAAAEVFFATTGDRLSWNGEHETLLELAEANGIEIESGCRAGNCGTCEMKIQSGKVVYPDGEPDDCTPGSCLVCVAQPDVAQSSVAQSAGPLVLEAPE